MTCNDLNRHHRDGKLNFDASRHEYTFDGRLFKSVTTLVEEFFPQFDPDEWAPQVALREGVDPQVIKARWEAEGERARNLGTEMHRKIECYYLGEDEGDDNDAFRLFRQFASSVTLAPFRTEWQIYHEDYDLAGTLDFLQLTEDGEYVLWDWKRSSKIVDRNGQICAVSRYGKMGFYPLSNIHDTPYWHYAIQTSVYRFILAEKYGINVRKAMLGVFHPHYDRAWVIPMPDMSDHVRAMLRHRMQASSPATAR